MALGTKKDNNNSNSQTLDDKRLVVRNTCAFIVRQRNISVGYWFLNITTIKLLQISVCTGTEIKSNFEHRSRSNNTNDPIRSDNGNFSQLTKSRKDDKTKLLHFLFSQALSVHCASMRANEILNDDWVAFSFFFFQVRLQHLCRFVCLYERNRRLDTRLLICFVYM